ncbi:MAG: hypothetical protein H0Z37_01075 [Firmicutes bacterium]|nr:hypothetical protein [Bacillota bacterium]
MHVLINAMTAGGAVVGGAVVLFGLIHYVIAGSVPALLIALAVVIAGPAEDLLKRGARKRAPSPGAAELWETAVDRATSLLFLLLLLVCVFLV